MGLAYASLDQTDNKTLIDRLHEQGQIKKRTFCIKIHYKKVSLPSEFIIGGCDVEADHWLPVVRKSYWTVTLNKIVLTSPTNGSEVLTIEPNAETIVDTGGNMGKNLIENQIKCRKLYVFFHRFANHLFECDYQSNWRFMEWTSLSS